VTKESITALKDALKHVSGNFQKPEPIILNIKAESIQTENYYLLKKTSEIILHSSFVK
jgi:hypothetical protein